MIGINQWYKYQIIHDDNYSSLNVHMYGYKSNDGNGINKLIQLIQYYIIGPLFILGKNKVYQLGYGINTINGCGDLFCAMHIHIGQQEEFLLIICILLTHIIHGSTGATNLNATIPIFIIIDTQNIYFDNKKSDCKNDDIAYQNSMKILWCNMYVKYQCMIKKKKK
eukprot:124916_1